MRGRVRRGGPGGVSRHGCCVQARDKISNPALRSVLEVGSWGGSPPGTTAVAKNETKFPTQHQGACPRGVSVGGRFCFAGGGGATPPGIYLTSLCPGRREVRPRTSTPLTYTIISEINRASSKIKMACRAGLSGRGDKYSCPTEVGKIEVEREVQQYTAADVSRPSLCSN